MHRCLLGGKSAAEQWVKGAFKKKWVGRKPSLSLVDGPAFKSRLKDAHHGIMLAIRTDRGGSSLASTGNEAKGLDSDGGK